MVYYVSPLGVRSVLIEWIDLWPPSTNWYDSRTIALVWKHVLQLIKDRPHSNACWLVKECTAALEDSHAHRELLRIIFSIIKLTMSEHL